MNLRQPFDLCEENHGRKWSSSNGYAKLIGKDEDILRVYWTLRFF